MITRLFRNRKQLDSEAAADRASAIEALTETEIREQQSQLAEIVRVDKDANVRRLALERITDPALLTALLDSADSPTAIAAHIAKLVEQGQVSELADQPLVIRARLADTPSATLIQEILTDADQALLLDAVLVCPREQQDLLLAHPAFRSANVLQDLERRSRDHDKRANRFARERLERLRISRAGAERLVGQIQQRLESLEKTSPQNSAAEMRRQEALLDLLNKDLQVLQDSARELEAAGETVEALPALLLRSDTLRKQARTANTQASAQQPLPAPEAATRTDSGPTLNAPARQSQVETFTALSLEFQALDEALKHSDDFEELASRRQTLTEQWLKSADLAPPSERQHEIFETVSHRFQLLADAHSRLTGLALPTLAATTALPQRLDVESSPSSASWQAVDALRRDLAKAEKQLETLDWPEWAAMPASLLEYRQRIVERSRTLEQTQAQLETLAARTTVRLQSLNQHLDDGEFNKARQEVTAVKKQLAALPHRLAQPLERQLSRASARLAELSDWQRFATSPKRESLCAAMKELAEKPPAEAKDQARRIKSLRTQWNELGALTGASDHRLLAEFNLAAEQAFEPCRAFFAEQAAQRAANLAARTDICDSLESYLASTDWDHADYKAAERIMRTARDEWRRFHPVDRTPGKSVEQRFETLQASLHEHIKAEWERNLASKQRIVAEAQALLESEQDRDKIEVAKSLQQQWQRVGVTPRRPDQALWRDFRKACDAVFDARDAARKRSEQATRAQHQEALTLLESFKALLDDEQTTFSASSLRDYRNRFEALPRLPERVQRTIDKRFSELLREAQLVLSNERLAAERQRLDGLKALDQAVSALEQQHQDGEDIQFEAPDPVFEQRFTLIDQPVPLDELRRLTIEAEIAAGEESVEADRELRLSIQVEMMNTGRSREALEADPDTLTARWCRLGPKYREMDHLRERFFSAIEKLAAR